MTFIDPRYYQIVILGALLLYGHLFLDFSLNPLSVALILISAQAVQYFFSKLYRLAVFDPKSSLISSLSLCILLRTEVPLLAVIAAVLAISSKFIIRYRGKHIFNPTSFALAVLLLVSPSVWISPGQWGGSVFFVFANACFAFLVLTRSRSANITLGFIGCYALILFIRAWWLGDPYSIPLHHMHNGAFLVFAFFMISDPKTIPDSHLGRLIFAMGVAVLGVYIQFYLYEPAGLLFSLALCAPLVPLLDDGLPAKRFEWTTCKVNR